MTTAEIERENTVDPAEIARFSALADAWWDPEGEFRPLHRFNPVRLGYIRDQICDHFDRDKRSLKPLEGLTILDVGCGGGLVTEPIARMGAKASAIDASERNIGVAGLHAEQGGLDIEYRIAAAETLAAEEKQFDVVMALEIVEHVADIDLFMASCAALTKPGGLLFVATLNRTAKSFTLAIVGAEYILRWMPRGTHQWKKFVKPSELAHSLAGNDAEIIDMTGVTYNPLKDDWRLSKDVAVNYMLCAKRT
jgi:2-polyprenyl-6-hydroxyphenyl methylase / 3-demethylubiquinone-9 3-methyltransferase